MAVQAVVFHLLQLVCLGPRLVSRGGPRHALDHHVAAKFACDDDQRPIKQSSSFQVENQLSDGAVNFRFHSLDRRVSIFVSIKVNEGNIFCRDFNKAGA